MSGVLAKMGMGEKDEGIKATAHSVASSDEAELARLGYRSEFARGEYESVMSPLAFRCSFHDSVLTLFLFSYAEFTNLSVRRRAVCRSA